LFGERVGLGGRSRLGSAGPGLAWVVSLNVWLRILDSVARGWASCIRGRV